MPQFIKMGLGGTGYRGHKGSYQRAAQRRARRRKVLNGYPITRPFESLDEVRQYLSGDKIVCLFCGKSYKVLGVHVLKIHGVPVDEYRNRYNIPWTYGVLCVESHDLKSQVIHNRMAEGWNPSNRSGEFIEIMKRAYKRKCPFKAEISLENLSAYNFVRPPPSPKPPKIIKLKQSSKRSLQAKWGSEEHREKLRRNAQVSGFGASWKGRKQSPEHRAKRLAAQESYLLRTGKKRTPRVHVETIQCLQCGSDVKQPRAGLKLYCSTGCRSKYYSTKKHTKETICSRCGNPFMANYGQVLRMRKNLFVFCSISCRQRSNSRRRVNRDDEQ